jgi:hypothetical protein
MSTAERDRRTVWRASFRHALSRGDVVGAVRAWDRLRVSGAAVTPQEADAGRAARLAVGHAIRDARWRRDHDGRFGFPILPDAPAAPRGRAFGAALRRVVPVAIVLALVPLALLLVRPGTSPAGQPEIVAAEASAIPTAIAASGRGRTSATIAPIVAATTAPTSVPQRTPGPTGPGGTGTAIDPVPGFLAALPPPQAGWGRFVFHVTDSFTAKPLANVCVIYGTPDCGPNRAHTNSLGLWWIDLPGDALAKTWDFGFTLDAYAAQRIQVQYVPGVLSPPHEVRMQWQGQPNDRGGNDPP